MFTATEASLDDLMHTVLTELIQSGRSIHPSKGDALEIVGAALELTNPRARLSRSESRSVAFSSLGELLWYLSGSDSESAISYYIPMYSELGVNGSVEGAYGPRLCGVSGQLAHVVEILRTKPDSRQAVVQVFDKDDLGNAFDVPCTCVMQFFLRDGLLDLAVHMRSNDVILGLPHDVYCFTMVQEIVARSIGAELGRYMHTVGSLHLYEKHKGRAEEYLGEGWHASAEMPAMPEGDPGAALANLLHVERYLRTNPGSEPSSTALEEPYWGDLTALLWAFRASKDRHADLARIAMTLQSDYFRIYLTERQLKMGLT